MSNDSAREVGFLDIVKELSDSDLKKMQLDYKFHIGMFTVTLDRVNAEIALRKATHRTAHIQEFGMDIVVAARKTN